MKNVERINSWGNHSSYKYSRRRRLFFATACGWPVASPDKELNIG